MRTLRRLTLFALAAFVLSLALAAGASAQYREFTGRIKSLSKDKMLVDNRMDDQVPFARFDGTVIEDASGGEKPKKEWRISRRAIGSPFTGSWPTSPARPTRSSCCRRRARPERISRPGGRCRRWTRRSASDSVFA